MNPFLGTNLEDLCFPLLHLKGRKTIPMKDVNEDIQ